MAKRLRSLADNEIARALEDDTTSEDGLDFDDDSLADPDFDPDFGELNEGSLGDGIDIDDLVDYLSDDDRNFNPEEEVEPMISSLDTPNTSGPSMKRRKPEKLTLLWKKKNLELNEQQLAFTGNESLRSDILDLEAPIDYFLYLFPPELIRKISEETNLYLIQKNANNTFHVSEIEIRQFIGVVYLMSLIQLPRVTNHWGSILGTNVIQDTMPSSKFEKIRQHLHFNDNSKCLPRSHPDADRIFKIRPVVDALNKAYAKVPLEIRVCVDEQICSTKARNMLKRYNPKKPHKWGYKLFVLSGVSGFAYKTEIETGKENVVGADEPDLGASSNVVVRLSRMIPRQQNHRIYFDNYFTSLPLLEYLAKEGILALGTIRRNRIPDCKLSTEKAIVKKDRGYSEEYVSTINGVDISTVVWKDNKLVTLASTFAGQNPISEVRRYDKKNSRYINISRPNVVGEYNRHMGGVDLIDSIMGIYKIRRGVNVGRCACSITT
ncbi:piggyBac transposable element-derived protein 3-like [Bactrocera dorsalis]|uniref:PiggyBac transposable element-derived protein 3-like n=1 Tax=Bactrocera dorsalis TaxID=27457 RepID=A0ABM3JNP7_BACDO|nr:piggyBac transposable element-derived protein 3-like [Bactrocera dorsalis]